MTSQAPAGNPEKSSGATLIGPLKDQIALLALLVTLAGLASTEGYYARFNLQYQFLGIPASHIVYRGLGIVRSGFYVALPYLAASAWLLIIAGRATPLRTERFQLTLTYGVVLAVTIATYLLAWLAGSQQAGLDRVESTSTLPRVMAASMKDMPDIDAGQKYRLLLMDNDYIVIFKPIGSAGGDQAPLIKRIAKDVVQSLETAR
ncbi:MAG: hypothetical protein WBY44_37620 [Bryobacteraceae bacterium]